MGEWKSNPVVKVAGGALVIAFVGIFVVASWQSKGLYPLGLLACWTVGHLFLSLLDRWWSNRGNGEPPQEGSAR